MPKARKTKHTKPQTKKTKKKRQVLRNLDNAELKKGNRVAGGSSKKTSQESIVERRQPRRSSRQKTYQEVDDPIDLSLETCVKDILGSHCEPEAEVKNSSESLNYSPPSRGESKSSKRNETEMVKLARPLELEFVEMRDWRPSGVMDY